MASIPAQEEVLAATRKSQEAMVAAVKNWLETVRTVTPKVAYVYSPLTDRLPKLSSISLPFADKLPTPQDAVTSAYNMAEELLASQRKFAEELLDAMTPLMPGRGAAASKSKVSGEPKVPGNRVWQEAVAVAEPKPVPASEPKPVPASTEPKTVAHASTAPKTVAAASTAPKTVTDAGAEPKTAARPAAKSAPARPAPRTAAAKSTGAKNGTGTSAAKRTTGSRTPKDKDAS